MRIYNPRIRFPYLICPYGALLIGLTFLCLLLKGGVYYITLMWLYFIIYHCINDQWQKRKADYYKRMILENYNEINIAWESALSNYIGWDEVNKITHEAFLLREKDRKEKELKNKNIVTMK